MPYVVRLHRFRALQFFRHDADSHLRFRLQVHLQLRHHRARVASSYLCSLSLLFVVLPKLFFFHLHQFHVLQFSHHVLFLHQHLDHKVRLPQRHLPSRGVSFFLYSLLLLFAVRHKPFFLLHRLFHVLQFSHRVLGIHLHLDHRERLLLLLRPFRGVSSSPCFLELLFFVPHTPFFLPLRQFRALQFYLLLVNHNHECKDHSWLLQLLLRPFQGASSSPCFPLQPFSALRKLFFLLHHPIPFLFYYRCCFFRTYHRRHSLGIMHPSCCLRACRFLRDFCFYSLLLFALPRFFFSQLHHQLPFSRRVLFSAVAHHRLGTKRLSCYRRACRFLRGFCSCLLLLFALPRFFFSLPLLSFVLQLYHRLFSSAAPDRDRYIGSTRLHRRVRFYFCSCLLLSPSFVP